MTLWKQIHLYIIRYIIHLSIISISWNDNCSVTASPIIISDKMKGKK